MEKLELVKSCPRRLFVCPLAVDSDNITTRHRLFFSSSFYFCSISRKRIRTLETLPGLLASTSQNFGSVFGLDLNLGLGLDLNLTPLK